MTKPVLWWSYVVSSWLKLVWRCHLCLDQCFFYSPVLCWSLLNFTILWYWWVKLTCTSMPWFTNRGSRRLNIFYNNSVTTDENLNLFNWLYLRHHYLLTSKKALESAKNCVFDNENKLCKVTCICRNLPIAGSEDNNSVTSNG